VKSDRNKSLQQLDGQDWGEPTFDSHLVTECHRLRRVPLRDFTVEDLRITIGQQIGLEYLVPLALDRLHDDPFVEGAYYPCDLLVNVLGAEARFWQSHPELRAQLVAITERAISLFPTVPDIASKTVTRAVRRAYEEFQKRQTPSRFA
jgi:CDI immunity proteins